jgi:hypothetical protein
MRLRITPFLLLAPVAVASLALDAACGNHFTKPTPDCTATVTPLSLTFEAAGGAATVGVTIASGCAWTAEASAGWIAAAPGTGSETQAVQIVVSANPNLQERTGVVTIAGRAVSVTQHGAAPAPACTFEVTPEQAAYSSGGGSGSITVATADGCAWSASSAVSWIAVTGDPSHSGSGALSYAVARNDEVSSRVGTLTVAGRTVTIEQDGDLAACSYAVSPVTFSPCLGAQEFSAAISTPAGCPWTASPDDDWITMLTGTSGLGSALIRFAVSANFDAPRASIVRVRWPAPSAGQNLHVAQAGCRYAVSANTFTVPFGGGSLGFEVYQQSDPYTCGGPLQNGCVWSAVSNAEWVVVTSGMPRAGDDHVAFTVAANPGSSPRRATITVRDQVVEIAQSGH